MDRYNRDSSPTPGDEAHTGGSGYSGRGYSGRGRGYGRSDYGRGGRFDHGRGGRFGGRGRDGGRGTDHKPEEPPKDETGGSAHAYYCEEIQLN